MKIDLSIYNRILFDDLRPWLESNKSEEKFRQKLTSAFKNPKGGSIAFEKAISTALKDHKTFVEDEDYIFEIKDDNIKFQSLPDEIFEPLIEIEIPEHHNHKTEFYFFLIRNEGTRLMNNLHKALQLTESESEKKYFVNSALQKVNSFLLDTVKQKKQIQKTQAAAQQKNNEYIFTAVKHTLIRLHLEMKEMFEPLLGSKAFNENGIFETILKEQQPVKSLVKDKVGLNAYRVKHFINAGKYSKQKTLELKSEILENLVKYFPSQTISKDSANRKAVLAEAIQALENLYYVREFDFAEANPNYETLLSEPYSEEIFAKATQAIAEKIEEHTLPNKRLAVITKEEQQLSFLQAKIQVDESVYTLSIPRRILLWLSGNKNFINANMQIDFSKLSEVKSQPIKTNLSVPQVALLFKMLRELKPDIFDIKTDAELHRFISVNFITKKSKEEGISTDKLRILFNQPDTKAAEFWEKHFYTLVSEVKKFK